MNPRLVGLSLAAVLVLATSGTVFGGRGAVYVDQDCTLPLEGNSITVATENLQVWLKLETATISDLHWHLFDNGVGVASGSFSGPACGGTIGQYTEYFTGYNPGVNGTGSFTLKVHFNNSDSNFGGDSFRIVP